MIKCENCSIKNCLLSNHCSNEWLEVIDVYKKEFKFSKGSEIITQGDRVEGIYFIESGMVKISLSRENQERIIRLAKEGDILGHRGFGNDYFYPITVKSLTDVTLTFIPMDIFIKVLKANANLSYNMMIFFAEELKNTEKRMQQMLHMTVIERISTAIMFNIDAFGLDEDNMLKYTLSRRELASLVGATYETVVRMLKKLEEQKVIKNIGKQIKILNLGEIKKHCVKHS